jgi:prevent-host-death family protein
MLRQLLAPGSLVCYKRWLEFLKQRDYGQRPEVVVDISFLACKIVHNPCLENGGQMLVSFADVHNRLSYWLEKVSEGPVTITRRGKPVGVLVSPEEYERLRQVQAYLEILRLSRSLQDSGSTADELGEGMETVTISPKYQVVIPSRIRRALEVRPGQKVVVLLYDNRVEMIPVKPIDDVRGLLRGIDTTIERDADCV